ncbi:lipocalin family protein [Fontimonas sp. SYSU GA230001]|uniref:lipocalin family protein n=1 Tax=Fontimonas sp. SYSU GA230001 TaxID=3142450 RepID=UPI0032B3CAF5
MRTLVVVVGILLLSACASVPKTPLPVPDPAVERERFLGRWYIVANVPYFFERGKVGSYVEYRPRADSRIDDFYFARDGSLDAPLEQSRGVAEIVDTASNAHWRAQFFWPFWASFHILYVDADYRHALIGDPSRDYGWIYARSPQIDPATLDALFARLEAAGYRREQFALIPQRATE